MNLRLLLIDNLDMPFDSAYRFPQAGVPLGIFTISGFLKEKLAGKIEQIDCLSLPLLLHEGKDLMGVCKESVTSNNYHLIGIRSLSAGMEYLETITQYLKSLPDCPPIILGGPYASDSPEVLLQNHQKVDFVVSREGEVIFHEFLLKWFFEKDPSWINIPGLSYRMDGQIFSNPQMKLIEDLDVLPIPDFGAIDLKRFSSVENPMRIPNGACWAPIMTQRGCPYRCTYCHEGFGKISREHSAEHVLKQIRSMYYDHGVRHIAFMDDIFNIRKERAKEIMREIGKSSMELQLSFPNGLRGDIMDEELVDLMIAAGTICIHYAVESASPRIQYWMKKNLKMDKITKIIEYTSQFDIVFRGFYMVGFPGETVEELQSTINHAIQSGFTETYFSILCMWPGTKIFEAAQQAGFVDDRAYTHSTQHDPRDNGFEFSVEFMMNERLRGYGHTHFDPKRVAKNFRVCQKLGINKEAIMKKEATYAQMISEGHSGSGDNPFVPDQFLFNEFLKVGKNPELAVPTFDRLAHHLGLGHLAQTQCTNLVRG